MVPGVNYYLFYTVSVLSAIFVAFFVRNSVNGVANFEFVRYCIRIVCAFAILNLCISKNSFASVRVCVLTSFLRDVQ